MGNVDASGGVTDVIGDIDGCRYTLVLVLMMFIVVLMVKVHVSLGDCCSC